MFRPWIIFLLFIMTSFLKGEDTFNHPKTKNGEKFVLKLTSNDIHSKQENSRSLNKRSFLDDIHAKSHINVIRRSTGKGPEQTDISLTKTKDQKFNKESKIKDNLEAHNKSLLQGKFSNSDHVLEQSVDEDTKGSLIPYWKSTASESNKDGDELVNIKSKQNILKDTGTARSPNEITNENKRAFSPWAGKRNFNQWNEKRRFSPWAGKRAFNPWAGKRAFNPWAGKRTPFSPWAGKRAPFSPWAGKRAPFSPWAGKRAPFSPWAGKRAPFSPWAGKRSKFNPTDTTGDNLSSRNIMLASKTPSLKALSGKLISFKNAKDLLDYINELLTRLLSTEPWDGMQGNVETNIISKISRRAPFSPWAGKRRMKSKRINRKVISKFKQDNKRTKREAFSPWAGKRNSKNQMHQYKLNCIRKRETTSQIAEKGKAPGGVVYFLSKKRSPFGPWGGKRAVGSNEWKKLLSMLKDITKYNFRNLGGTTENDPVVLKIRKGHSKPIQTRTAFSPWAGKRNEHGTGTKESEYVQLVGKYYPLEKIFDAFTKTTSNPRVVSKAVHGYTEVDGRKTSFLKLMTKLKNFLEDPCSDIDNSIFSAPIDNDDMDSSLSMNDVKKLLDGIPITVVDITLPDKGNHSAESDKTKHISRGLKPYFHKISTRQFGSWGADESQHLLMEAEKEKRRIMGKQTLEYLEKRLNELDDIVENQSISSTVNEFLDKEMGPYCG